MATSVPSANVEAPAERRFEQIVGRSAALEAVLAKVERVAPTGATVLIEGETGTGKELIARAIHNLSPRCGRPFVKVNCAAIPGDLMESELFGHERGAFTGAVAQRIGRFETAQEGTLFLDEVGELPCALQSKLLRVLQEREFERVGSSRTQSVDVRVVAATNRNLTELMEAGRFRDDLYYRLNVFPIAIPSLRDRREDIPALVTHFVDLFGRRIGRSIDTIPPPTMKAFMAYSWPGNIRELQNMVERAVILSDDGVLPNPIPPPTGAAPATDDCSTRQEIEHALHASRGRVSGADGAARALGVPPSTLESRIQRLGIDKFAFRRCPPNKLAALGAA
jgi:transcriptional regulator with GAF, ATPase, and Fis domain